MLKKKRFWLIAAIVFLVMFICVRFIWFDGYVTLENLRYHRILIQNFIDNHYWASMFLFWCVYVFENIVALPIAAIMTIAAGYFYGTVPAILLTIVSATCGAWVSFFLARFVVGNYVQVMYKDRLMKFNHEFKRHGAYYLLMVRFLPFIPFVLINMFAGLTLVPFSTFTWTTVFGMIPLVIMYALAGSQLQTITSVHDIFSWQMIAILGTLVALTVLPLVLKKLRLVNGNQKNI